VVAAAVAAIFSGGPSTAWNLATGSSVLASTEAAGTLLLHRETSRVRLVIAGAAAHVAISLWWAQVLARVLPRRHTILAGAAAGAAIAAFDLGVVGRRHPAIRALPVAPQLADHLAFGALVGAVISHLRQDANL
jgi:hypothetical protein